MDEGNITHLDDKRKKVIRVTMLNVPPPAPKPTGPFTVTVSDPEGKMFEVVFPDYTGDLPDGTNVQGMCGEGIPETLCNLLTGAMRVYLGAK